jgi:hypothetical protein
LLNYDLITPITPFLGEFNKKISRKKNQTTLTLSLCRKPLSQEEEKGAFIVNFLLIIC